MGLRKRTPRPGLTTLLLAAGWLAAGCLGAGAETAADRGRAVVEQWCRLCHLHAGDRPDADMAPPFEAIMARPGRNEAFLVRFLGEDHFPMPIYRLFDDEKRDVVAYLLSLGK